jgi:hypothetical protein
MQELPQFIDRKRRTAAVNHGVTVRANRAEMVDRIHSVSRSYRGQFKEMVDVDEVLTQ